MTSKLKTSREWSWLAILLIGMLSIVITSCGDDDDNAVTPEPVEPEEASQAFLLGYRTNTPNGQVYYMSTHENIPNSIDISQAVEIGLGGNTSITSFNGQPYSWNGDAATMTQWSIDKSTLELTVEGILSFGSTGYSGEAFPIFISETQAYVTRLTEGLVVEWNPSTMEITEVINVPTLPDLGVEYSPYTDVVKYEAGGKIVMPIWIGTPRQCCDFDNYDGAMIAVFDPATKILEYKRDNRLLSTGPEFARSDNGDLYVSPVRENSFIEPYFNVDTTQLAKPFNLLRIDQSGNIDPTFEFDIAEVLPITFFRAASGVFNNKFIFTYADDTWQWPDAYDDRFQVFGGAEFQTVAVDLTTGEVESFSTEFGSVNYRATLAGTDYFVSTNFDPNTFEVNESKLLVQGSLVDDFTEVSSIQAGQFVHIDKLF